MDKSRATINNKTADKKIGKVYFKSDTDKDPKAELKLLISRLTKLAYNLERIKKDIELKWDRSLDVMEIVYIERKFIRHCSDLWFHDVINCVTTLIKSNAMDDFLMSIDSARYIKDVPECLQKSKYYVLLNENIKLTDEHFEKNLIYKIRNLYLELAVEHNAIVKQELQFMENFLSYLDSCKNIQDTICKLDLFNFLSDKTSFYDLLTSIINLENNSDYDISYLKEVATILQKETHYFLLNKIKRSICDVIKPAEIRQKIIDHVCIVEIESRNLKISNVISNIESLLKSNAEIVEVQFIIINNLYIDTDLKNATWHGKNISIIAKNIYITEEVSWDVSGQNSQHIFETDAGADEDGCGKDGSDGYPGESGGNVYILTKTFTNEDMFSIISNGGKGSDGQNGGNGVNGADGQGITRDQFKDRFLKFFKCKCSTNIKNMINYIKCISFTIQCEWMSSNDVYLEVTTPQGNQITFSFGFSNLSHMNNAFLLYKGALGKPGKPGGSNGLGGQGGYAGSIEVKDLSNNREFRVKKCLNDGDDGKIGNVGMHGKHGKSSCDMGYIHYSNWIFRNEMTEIYDSSDNNINIEYYANSGSKRVWCEYKDAYAELTVHKMKNTQRTTYRDRQNSKQSKDRQHFSRAIKKKNVLKTNLTQHIPSIVLDKGCNFQDVRSQIQEVELPASHSFSLNENQQHTMDNEIKINHIYSYSHSATNKSTTKIIENLQIKKPIILKYDDIETILNVIRNMPRKVPSINPWLQYYIYCLKYHKLDICQLNLIYTYWQKLVQETMNKNKKFNNVERVFVEKYRIAVLQEIDQKIKHVEKNFNYRFITTKNKIGAIEATKYLNIRKQKYNNIHHNVLGFFNQYIFDNKEQHRKNIINYCKNHFLETRKEELGHIFEKFYIDLLEAKADNDITTFFESYTIYLKEKEEKIMTHYNIFKSELTKLRHEKILTLMLTNTLDKNSRIEIMNKIEQNPFLKIIYEKLNKQYKFNYNWSKYLHDKNIMDFFFKFINQNGLNCRCYRELLAYIFDVNIRVYCVKNKDLSLNDNHNSSSRNVIYLLCNDTIFTEIDIDVEYFQLYKKNKCLDNIYFNVLSDIYTLKTKRDLTDYLRTYTINTSTQKYMQSYFIDKSSVDEEEDIENIALFFPSIERQQIISKLQTIKSQHIGHSGIIKLLLKIFEFDGRIVSNNEIAYIINQILESSLKDTEQENRICWIVATVFQDDWMAEILLMQLESFFMKMLNKDLFRKYLKGLDSGILTTLGVKLFENKRDNISISHMEDTLYLLNNISEINIDLHDIDLCQWYYVLKEYYWVNRIEKLFNEKQLGSIPYYILCMENMFGMKMINKFLDIVAEKNICRIDINTFEGILENFHDERWNLGREELICLRKVNNILEWIKQLDVKFSSSDTERNVVQLVKLIQENTNTSINILDNLPNISQCLINVRNYVLDGKYVKNFTENDIKMWVKKLKNDYNIFEIFTNSFEKMWCNNSHTNNSEPILDQRFMLALIDRAIELKRGFKLRDTQILTVMSLLYNNNSTLAQVSTGEGKSLVVVALSILKAICGEKVDVVTSSSVLAIRDAECNKDIYNLFKISVSHNCSESIEKCKESYSKSSVIYGNLSNFQRDYLLDRFYGKNILGDHDFSNIIIDEVDSMLLDKGNNMLYLSHDIAGLDKLESVYLYIWSSISRPFQNTTDLAEGIDITKLKEAVLNDLYGIIMKNDIEKLDITLNEKQKAAIWIFLTEAKILSSDGRLLINDASEINYAGLPSKYKYLQNHITYLLDECIKRKRYIYVPEYLKPYIERHLESWINNAIMAFIMNPGQDYVVDIDRTKSISDGNPIITIIDRDTGTDQISSQWDEALHQFLQLKHGCKLTMQSLKAVFISNVSFFKLYRRLYGLTGTLGSQRERNLLKEIHNVDFVTVPTAKTKKFHEIAPIVCKDKEEWVNSIYDDIKIVVNEEKRSTLIICQLVDDVEFLRRNLTKRGINNIHTYSRDYEEFAVARGSKKLEEGQVIIATNLAGRGTDIVLTDTLRKNGGLHVCLTYLPSNIRIERQAFGRAARCGDNGTGRLIIIDIGHQGGDITKVLNLKKDRDAEELNRISIITSNYINKITIEENCFEEFKTLYEKIKNRLKEEKVSDDLKSIILQSCLDKWAFWLDENGHYIQCNEGANKNIFYDSFQLFLTQINKLIINCIPLANQKCTAHIWYNWVKENPAKIVMLGKYFINQAEFQQAIFLFDAVIQKESIFSEAAHYYKAFALSKEKDWGKQLKYKEKRTAFKNALRTASRLFKMHSDRALSNATLIDQLKENNSVSIIQIQAYMQQQKTFSKFYNMFIKSIDDILGSCVTPNVFESIGVNEIVAEFVFKDLKNEGLLIKPKIKKNIIESELKSISQDFGISSKILFNFLSKRKGMSIDEKIFLKALKNEINLPTLEDFWKMLQKQGILTDEVKFVIIDRDKLSKLDESYLEFLTLKISHGEMITPDLEEKSLVQPNKIYINGKCISEQKNENNIILYKNELASLDASKYEFLKTNGILSFNKMASVDINKIKYVKFDCFDSIIAHDFDKIDISLNQAEELLTQLVSEGILEREKLDENQYIYRLKVKYDEISEIKLHCRQVYKNSVIALLFICFAYRITIEKLEKHLKENKPPFRIQLMSRPHQNLVFELAEKKILKHTKVSPVEAKSIEERVKYLFKNPISEKNMLDVLVNSGLVCNEKATDLFSDLRMAGWIKNDDSIFGDLLSYKILTVQEIQEYLANKKSEEEIPNLFSVFSSSKSGKSDCIKIELPTYSLFKPIHKSLRNLLEYRHTLGTSDTNRIICKTLNQLKSSLKSLSVPVNNLKDFADYISSNKFQDVDELHIMYLNGLDHVQFLEEKKQENTGSTAVVFGVGIIELAIGVIIQFCSMGILTHVGSFLISEGISDMVYATNAYKSGYFSWNDYLHHKLQSMMFSAISVGVGAILSYGVQYSRFGEKLFGPAFRQHGGFQLMRNVGVLAVCKSICVEVLKGFAKCAVSYAADTTINKYLNSFCIRLGSLILANIDKEVDKHNLSNSLEKVFNIHGESKAKSAICPLTDSFFQNNNIDKNLLPIAIKISSSITSGIQEAAIKQNNTNSGLLFTFNCITKFLVWSNKIQDIYMVSQATNKLLDNLHEEINKKLISPQSQKEVTSNKDTFSEEKYYSFKKEIMDIWKSYLQQQATQVIEQHVIRPILEESMHKIIQIGTKKVKGVYRVWLENSLETQKENFERHFKNSQNFRKNKSSTITDLFHNNLLKLLDKTRNPELFANIILEGVPMGLTCFMAAPEVITTYLEQEGFDVPELAIVVNAENEISRQILLGSKNDKKEVIQLQLKNNHYKLIGGDDISENSSTNANDCLYQALASVIPDLKKLGPQSFRTAIANCIKQSPEIRNHIENGWHKYLIRLNIYGGRGKSLEVFDPDSTEQEIKNVDQHMVDRILRLIRVSGTVQRISKDTNIPRTTILKGAKSQFQDKHSKMGRKFHASHVVRAAIDKCLNREDHVDGFEELKNIVGHTQILPRFANEWHGFGGVMDKFQEDALNNVSSHSLHYIDFKQDFEKSENAEFIINSLKSDYTKRIRDFLNTNKIKCESDRASIERGLKTLNQISAKDIYECGQDGYNGKYKDAYL